ncbi:hypothetical protein C8Q76DRAFT_724368 [Earliella scabrosa]|nr:hypothetical protein C8Q76DRAFT_724368 [Earliella scabrosa]
MPCGDGPWKAGDPRCFTGDSRPAVRACSPSGQSCSLGQLATQSTHPGNRTLTFCQLLPSRCQHVVRRLRQSSESRTPCPCDWPLGKILRVQSPGVRFRWRTGSRPAWIPAWKTPLTRVVVSGGWQDTDLAERRLAEQGKMTPSATFCARGGSIVISPTSDRSDLVSQPRFHAYLGTANTSGVLELPIRGNSDCLPELSIPPRARVTSGDFSPCRLGTTYYIVNSQSALTG